MPSHVSRSGTGRRLLPSDARYPPLFLRLFGVNAVVLALVCGMTVIALTPGALVSEVALKEVAILVAGLAAMIVVNLLLVRRITAPLERLTESARRIDPRRSRQRVVVDAEASEAAVLGGAFNDALERIEGERQESRRAQLAAQEAERLRVAQELHDEVGQSLTGVLLQLRGLSRRLEPELQPALSEVQETARASLDDVRRIAERLRPDALEELGLVSALEILAGRVREQSGLEVALQVDDAPETLSREQELVVFRVAQEALTNVSRHAEAERVELRLATQSDVLELLVLDDGVGIGAAAPGTGRRGMQERAQLIGADLDVGPASPRGTRVALGVPLSG